MSDEPVSRYFTSQRLRLHVADWGNESAPPLILVHGGEDHARSLDALARRLGRDWHVLALDLRGHGLSDWTSDGVYAGPSFVLDLANLVAELGSGPVRLVGHSLGGAIVLRYGGIFPDQVAAIVAIEGVGHTPPRLQRKLDRPCHQLWAEWIAEQRALSDKTRRIYPTLEAAVARLRAANPRLSEPLARHLTQHGTQPVAGGFCWRHDPAIRAFLPVDISRAERLALLERIVSPVFLLRGEESWASDPVADGTAAHFRQMRVMTVPGAGHWLHHDAPELVAAAIADFLGAR